VARILTPLPDCDFDPSEAAVPWRVLREAGHEVVVATERGGSAPAGDPVVLNGFVAGRFGASEQAKAAYRELERSPEFSEPVAWESVDPAAFDGLVLPGGHAPGMRQYLGSPVVQAHAAEFMRAGKPVGAICHGVVVLARAGVLAGRRTTCLPKYLERLGAAGMAWKRSYSMRTYPEYVEDEVRAALSDPERDFERGPLPTKPWAHEDGSYVSARWYGDAEVFARRFVERF
jgi:putative intracellular protease/amidase